METLLGPILLLFILLFGLSMIVGGANGPKKLFGAMLAPFGCLLKLGLGLLVLLLFASIAMQALKEKGIRPADDSVPITEPPVAERTIAWPLPENYRTITQEFGDTWSANSSKRHTGIDIAAPRGTEVYAATSGTVTREGSLMGDSQASREWGYYLVISHDGGEWTTSYLHINPMTGINEGTQLEAGQLLGWIYHDHLHFGVRQAPTNQISPRGALPIRPGDPRGDPIFPEEFVDPMQVLSPR